VYKRQIYKYYYHYVLYGESSLDAGDKKTTQKPLKVIWVVLLIWWKN
jgi:hypothetical protein